MQRVENVEPPDTSCSVHAQRWASHKAFSAPHDDKLAAKDFRRAKELDANAPTAWLYSALHAWQGNRINEAVPDLETSSELNDSIRLEPTQIGGFNQAYRSLIPESVAGLVPGTEFETINIAFDRSFQSGTYFGLAAERVSSDGHRTVGVLTNSNPFILAPDSPSSTKQTLEFHENTFSAYAAQLLGESFSVGPRYRVSVRDALSADCQRHSRAENSRQMKRLSCTNWL